VANRLTENPKWSVLLVEAGEEENFFTDVPLIAALQSVTAYNWNYHAQKLKTACLGLNYGRCSITRGKAIGGTSVLNFLIYTRGNRQDYDSWAAMGNEGWSYDEVLPYFIKSENCTLCRQIDEEYHGKNGYLNIEHPGYESPFVKLFIKAGHDMGYKNCDINGKIALGFSKVQATMKNGRRCSAAKAFLKPIQERQNLQVSKNSRATKILIDGTSKRAYGVEFWKNKRKYKIKVRKEVILSAGAINSPHLLMLSGIGPREDLERVKIPVIQDLKVGYNFQDHVAMSTLAFLVNQSVTVSDLTVQNPIDIYNYLAISIADSEHFRPYGTHLNPHPFPQCTDLPFGSDDYWTCAIRHVSTSLGHHVGTCRMGPKGDPDAVVDPRLRVHGIRGLRVVDGSVMPNIVAGHTNAPIFMIGERAADFIKQEWRWREAQGS
ncbi:unnamed protein product, partial [Callosobruchus maculatus]